MEIPLEIDLWRTRFSRKKSRPRLCARTKAHTLTPPSYLVQTVLLTRECVHRAYLGLVFVVTVARVVKVNPAWRMRQINKGSVPGGVQITQVEGRRGLRAGLCCSVGATPQGWHGVVLDLSCGNRKLWVRYQPACFLRSNCVSQSEGFDVWRAEQWLNGALATARRAFVVVNV